MNWFEKFLVRKALADGWFRFDELECELPSGRKFRYQLRDYHFRVDASEADLDRLACQIIKDKYRYCDWDQNHPRSNSEVEIFDAVKKWMLAKVAMARQVHSEDNKERR
jgi:hypothetical protein